MLINEDDLTDLETAKTVIGQIGAGKDSATLTKGGILAADKLVEFRLHEILPEGTVYEYPIMVVEYYGATASANVRGRGSHRQEGGRGRGCL